MLSFTEEISQASGTGLIIRPRITLEPRIVRSSTGHAAGNNANTAILTTIRTNCGTDEDWSTINNSQDRATKLSALKAMISNR